MYQGKERSVHIEGKGTRGEGLLMLQSSMTEMARVCRKTPHRSARFLHESS